MAVYNRRELFQKKLIGFLKYEVQPYLIWANKISERMRNKPVVDLNENELLLHSGMRMFERLVETILSFYFNPMLSMGLFVDGFGNYTAIVGYDCYHGRKKSV